MNGKKLMMAAVAASAALGLYANTYYVTPTGAGLKDGSDWDNAFGSIGDAVAACGTAAGEVRVLAGTYELAAQVSVPKWANITINGGYSGSGEEHSESATIVKAATGVRTRLFFVDSRAKLVLDHLTLKDGCLPEGMTTADTFGNAIFAQGDALTLTFCDVVDNGGAFSDNKAHGAAVCAATGTLTVEDCHFRNNAVDNSTPNNGNAVEGGAIRAKQCTTTIRRTTFDANSVTVKNAAGGGGAIHLSYAANAVIEDCVFTSNAVIRTDNTIGNEYCFGGHLYAFGTGTYRISVKLARCTFIGGSVNNQHTTESVKSGFGHGGSICFKGSTADTDLTATVKDCVIYGAGYREGADIYDSGSICVQRGSVALENTLVGHVRGNCLEVRLGTVAATNCTFAGAAETTGGNGYGIFQAGGSLSVYGSVIGANALGDYHVSPGVTSATFTYCCFAGVTSGVGNIAADPRFGDDVYFHLASRAGRYDGGWFEGGAWTVDAEDSPAIDAGPAAADVGEEPQPNRHRVNIGYDAGKATASKSNLGTPPVPEALAVYMYPYEDTASTEATLVGEIALGTGGSADVWLYWGATDGGTDAGAWDSSAALGSQSDWTLFRHRVGDMTGKTYFRFFADDGATTAWSDAADFTPSLPPSIADCEVGHLTRTSFLATGTLTSDGGFPTVVRVRYWTDDEAKAVTVNYNDGNPVASGTQFSIKVAGLSAGVTYNYVIEAVNQSGPVGEAKTVATLPSSPMIAYVTPDGAGARDGSSWENAFGDLQEAIDLCDAAGDLICMKAGEYSVPQTKDLLDPSDYLLLSKPGLTIRGGYAGTGTPGARAGGATVLRRVAEAAENPWRRVLHAVSSVVTLDSLTIADGAVDCGTNPGNGSGLMSENSTAIVTNCVFTGNGRQRDDSGTAYGGAIYASGGSLAAQGCTFTNNVVEYKNSWTYIKGAAIYTTGGAALHVSDCVFRDNFCRNIYAESFGAAVCAEENGSGTVLIERCSFSDNAIVKHKSGNSNHKPYGGTVYLKNVKDPVIRDCTIDGGYSVSPQTLGGCMYFEGANQKAVLERISVLNTGKGADCHSGSIYLKSGTLAMTNCLFAANGVGDAVEVAGGTFAAVTNLPKIVWT